jgi:amino acid transporter
VYNFQLFNTLGNKNLINKLNAVAFKATTQTFGIVIGALLMILIAVSYGALVEKFPVSGGAFAFSFLNSIH